MPPLFLLFVVLVAAVWRCGTALPSTRRRRASMLPGSQHGMSGCIMLAVNALSTDQSNGWHLREARSLERRLAASFLPQAMRPWHDPAVIIALPSDESRLLGAAAVVCGASTTSEGELTGAPCAVHVVQDCRGRGVRRALLHECDALALHWGVPALRSFEPIEEGSDEAIGFERLGFQAGEVSRGYRADASDMAAALLPLWDRLMNRRGLPDGARTVPIAEIAEDQVVRLQAMHLGGRPERAKAMLHSGAYNNSASNAVLLPDDRLGGVILCRWTEADTVSVDSRVIAPGIRGTWVNLALMIHSINAAMKEGLRAIDFEAGPRNRDTHLLAKRSRAETVRSGRIYLRSVPTTNPV